MTILELIRKDLDKKIQRLQDKGDFRRAEYLRHFKDKYFGDNEAGTHIRKEKTDFT